MLSRLKKGQCRTANPMRGRILTHQLWKTGLQVEQLTKERIILAIGDERIIEYIIAIRMQP